MMAPSAASLSATPMPFKLSCCNWTIKKHSIVLDVELMEDALRQSVSARCTPAMKPRMVNAPVWLQRAYKKINTNLQSMASLIEKLEDER